MVEKFGHIKKKQYFCTAVPVIPLPDMMLVMNPGFFICMAKSELDILSSAFSAQRLSKYLAYNKGDAERTVLGWMNEDMPDWLAKIDPFDKVSADIRKEMGWR